MSSALISNLVVAFIAVGIAYATIQEFLSGEAKVLRGSFGPYLRSSQPLRYWASVALHTLVGGIFVWMVFIV